MAKACQQCRYWAITQHGSGVGGYNTDGQYSQCRIRAPVFIGDASRDSYFAGKGTAWPYTHKDDWCGEFQARENT